MTGRVIKIVAAVAAATALVAGGYAIGTRTDGSASAAGQHAGRGHHGWPHPRGARRQALTSLAGRLGVSEAKLRQALKDLRPQRRAARREDRVAALAKVLGISEAKVRAALQKARAQHRQDRRQRRDDFANALATKLGLDPAKVRSALDEFTAQRRHRHP